MVPASKIMIPVAIGLSLCSASAVLLYLLLKKEDDSEEGGDEASSKFTKQIKRVPQDMAASIIGRGGTKIKELEQLSGARIKMTDSSEDKDVKLCTIHGNPTAVELASGLIEEIIELQKSIETSTMSVPHWAIGKVIGKGGDNINNVSRASGAKIKVESGRPGTATTRNVAITGLPDQILIATKMIEKLVEESKHRRDTEGKRREPRGKHTASKEADPGADLGTKGSSRPQNAPPAGSSGALLEVFVSAISSPSRFWLQIVGPQVEELDKLVDTMTEYYGDSENREMHKLTNVQVGQIVAAVFRHDGKWYRAKVAEIKPNEFDETQKVCDLYFVDYGDNEFVAMDELYSLRTDMLKLRFQAVECFLAGVTAHSPDGPSETRVPWSSHAIERFEELTQVARWKRLWSRTCTFRERPTLDASPEDGNGTQRNARAGSPIPGVKLYDTRDGVDINIAQVLIDEGLASEKVDEEYTLPARQPTTPTTPLPPTFGDLECSRVLGMVIGNREDRASSLPHGGSSPSTSPKAPTHLDDSPAKSLSLAAGIDNDNNRKPPPNPVEMSYPKPDITNGQQNVLNGSTTATNGVHDKTHQNGDFLNAERGGSGEVPQKEVAPSQPQEPKAVHPFHVPDPKDELKAKINRVESHHGSLEVLGKQAPPPSLVNSP